MNTQILGLHTCKPANTPKVGQVKQFFVYEETSRAGKQYTKIRNPDIKKGETGRPYTVTEVEKTDYTDSYGNVSFNLTLEPQQSGPTPARPMSEPRAVQTVTRGPNTAEPQDQDTARQHIMRAANLYNLCADAVSEVIYPNNNAAEETWRAAVSSLFIEASSRRSDDNVHWWSYIDKMPSTFTPTPPPTKHEPERPF